jgi:hypothetical protein
MRENFKHFEDDSNFRLEKVLNSSGIKPRLFSGDYEPKQTLAERLGFEPCVSSKNRRRHKHGSMTPEKQHGSDVIEPQSQQNRSQKHGSMTPEKQHKGVSEPQPSLERFSSAGITLTQEQKEKLTKLTMEMEKKKKYEVESKARREDTSQKTGIPADLVDLDVIKLGTILGLIRPANAPQKKRTLLDLIFPSKSEPEEVDISWLPFNYKRAPSFGDEKTRVEMHLEMIKEACSYIVVKINHLVEEGVETIRKISPLDLNHQKDENDGVGDGDEQPHYISKKEAFVVACEELSEVMIDAMDVDDHLDVKNTLEGLALIHEQMLGPLDIFRFKEMVEKHINMLRKEGVGDDVILNHLSTNDARLVLFPGFHHKKASELDFSGFFNEVDIRSFSNVLSNPHPLVPFSLETLAKNLCTPSLISIPVDYVIKQCFLNHINDNGIVYLQLQGPIQKLWSFYVLKEIKNGVRMWCLDQNLETTSLNVALMLLDYLRHTFRVFYRSVYGSNAFDINCGSSQAPHFDVVRTLIYNMVKVNNLTIFRSFLRELVVCKSSINPTQNDVFNSLVFHPSVRFEENETVFDVLTLLSDLFDGGERTDMVRFYAECCSWDSDRK